VLAVAGKANACIDKGAWRREDRRGPSAVLDDGDAARTASRNHLSRQLELTAAQRGLLPPPQLGGIRRMELLAGRLGDLALSELVGDLTQDPVKGRLGGPTLMGRDQ
jgi:hypothetical protein